MSYVIGMCVLILMVAAGLGFVIFVHELGHFLVAKLCGVKCEKFYLGFDIGGVKLCKFQWGETEYGVGILPLGGYVKMLGQEDNPAKQREEMERAQQGRGESGEGRGKSDEPSALLYDPRSYLAKSVPKRMAIISAGVIMNVIFAFLMAVVAFVIGVEQIPCVIGSVFPGEPAWQADLRVGDEILEIAGKKMTQFRDLTTAISLGDIDPDKGVPILVRRIGVKDPLPIVVKPDSSRGVFIIGVTNGKTTRLFDDRTTWLVQKRPPVLPGSVAAQATPQFRNGDKIVEIDDAPIENYAQIDATLARKADQKITVTVERTENDADGKGAVKIQRLAISVAPNPMRTLGLAMKMGEITAIQADSPAAAAGIKAGDIISKIDGHDVADPMMLPDQLRRRAGETIELTLRRKTTGESDVVRVRLREPLTISLPEMDDSPLAISSLGVAYRVLNVVDQVVEGSPAAKAGILPGDQLVNATLIPPDPETLGKLNYDESEASVPFSEKQRNWPAFVNGLQSRLPGTTIKLAYSRNGKEQTVTLKPIEAEDWFSENRGFLFEPMMFAHKGVTIGSALALGGRDTLDNLTIVFRTVRKLSTNQVSLRNMGGPWMIFKLALQKADQGAAVLLLFLTMLSANLAVLNSLPIPVLDGGHLVLLAYEGIRGKPANEHVQVVLSYIGLILIIALMVWVCGLDFGLISRH